MPPHKAIKHLKGNYNPHGPPVLIKLRGPISPTTQPPQVDAINVDFENTIQMHT